MLKAEITKQEVEAACESQLRALVVNKAKDMTIRLRDGATLTVRVDKIRMLDINVDIQDGWEAFVK